VHYHKKLQAFLIFASLYSVGIYVGAATARECPTPSVLTTTTPSPPQTPGGWTRYLAIKSAAQSSGDVVFLGDSLVSNWPSKLLSNVAPGRSVLNWGVPGDRTQQVLWRLQQLESAQLRPQIVVLLIGTNNLSARDDSCAIAQGIKAILQRIHVIWGTLPVLLVNIPPRGEELNFRVDDRHEITAEIRMSMQNNVTLLDWEGDLIRAPSAFRPDRTHFTYQGYEILTPLLAAALSSALLPLPAKH
jgi:platelet-activating factor acetylhydrolase IB subunit beta/gamma